MAANNSPVFALTPQVATAVISGATTDKSGSTTTFIKIIYTAATNGTKVTQIGFKSTGNSTAGIFLIWITDVNGANPILFDEILYTTISSSTTVATARGVNLYSDLELKSGQQIWVGATIVTTGIHAFVQVGEF